MERILGIWKDTLILVATVLGIFQAEIPSIFASIDGFEWWYLRDGLLSAALVLFALYCYTHTVFKFTKGVLAAGVVILGIDAVSRLGFQSNKANDWDALGALAYVLYLLFILKPFKK